MTVSWQQGNAADDGSDTRGWFVGHFIDPTHGVRASKDVEVKWFRHPAGDRRPEWTRGDLSTTLSVLVEGEFRVDFAEGSALLAKQGDYVMWGPGVDHSWEALADSVVMSVRWPSQGG